MSELILLRAENEGLKAQIAVLKAALLERPAAPPVEVIPARPSWAKDLQRLEWRFLSLLIEAEGNVVTHDTLADRLLGEDSSPDTLKVHVHNIRRKLGDDIIITAFREGYRFNAGADVLRAA